MEDLEERAIMTTTHKPNLWIRYVDDTFVVWPHRETKVQEFLEHLNNLHAAIKFTMGREQNQLPFLDVLLKKKPDGRLAHTVYRKPTHTNRYLNADSHHQPAQLHSVINMLVNRSLKLADQNHQPEEKKGIRRILI
jgi:hypothetical protein